MLTIYELLISKQFQEISIHPWSKFASFKILESRIQNIIQITPPIPNKKLQRIIEFLSELIQSIFKYLFARLQHPEEYSESLVNLISSFAILLIYFFIRNIVFVCFVNDVLVRAQFMFGVIYWSFYVCIE